MECLAGEGGSRGHLVGLSELSVLSVQREDSQSSRGTFGH